MHKLFYIVLILVLVAFFAWLFAVQTSSIRFNKQTGEVLNAQLYNNPIEIPDNDDCDVGNCINGSLISNETKRDIYCAHHTDEEDRNNCYSKCK